MEANRVSSEEEQDQCVLESLKEEIRKEQIYGYATHYRNLK